jgi:hypothetical protein
MTTAERRAQALGRSWPLEAREDLLNRAKLYAAALKSGIRIRELHTQGAWSRPRPPDLSEAG